MYALINLVGYFLLQCIYVSSHHEVYLKYLTIYLLYLKTEIFKKTGDVASISFQFL